ncbi:hypothetical protein ACFSCX_07750 [Bacillus salitolerans]|uniref:Uncharacterized protein n=1 Tax=Bacillus salitolerans TaxID=1437434 RepID=A0ABW4LMZ4_9BACI
MSERDDLGTVRDASERGAREDIIHFTEYDGDEYDLRKSNPLYEGTRQKIDENGSP